MARGVPILEEKYVAIPALLLSPKNPKKSHLKKLDSPLVMARRKMLFASNVH